MQTLLSQKFTAYIGINWTDTKHDVCLQVADETPRHFSVIDHTPQSIDRWAKSLFERYGAPIAIALELSKDPLVSVLQKDEFFCLFTINPSTLARHRKTVVCSGAKDDPTDAQWALELLLTHPQRFPQLMPQSPATRILASLTEHRRGMVDERVKISNRLVCTLKQYYPLALKLYSNHDTGVFCDFLMRWTTIEHIKRSRQSAFLKFSNDHNMRRPQLQSDSLGIDQQCDAFDTGPWCDTPFAAIRNSLASQLKGLIPTIKDFDRKIDETANALADYPIFKALPGAGKHLAPRLLVAFGEQRDRFSDAGSMQRYVGIAPVTQRSGKKKVVYWRYQCSTLLRQTFVEWAAHSITESTSFEAYFRQQRAKGCSYQAVLRALAFKSIRIVYRCWKTSTVYDEKVYLQDLLQRGSTLIEAPVAVATS